VRHKVAPAKLINLLHSDVSHHVNIVTSHKIQKYIGEHTA